MPPGDHRDDERRHADRDERPPQCEETSQAARSPRCHPQIIPGSHELDRLSDPLDDLLNIAANLGQDGAD